MEGLPHAPDSFSVLHLKRQIHGLRQHWYRRGETPRRQSRGEQGNFLLQVGSGMVMA